MDNKQRIREKISTKEGRQKILDAIHDLAYLGPVNETKRKLEERLGDEALHYINNFGIVEEKAVELMILVEELIRKIDAHPE
ncbi:MAG: hypothetical protein QW177_08000 [Candidatus Nitrosotenuis sp.]